MLFLLLIALALALTGLGVYGLVYAVNAYRRYRYIADLPTSTVRAAAVGLTEVKGRAVPAEETITSPFGETPCLLCHYVGVYSREGEDHSIPFAAGTLGVPFYLEDDTGRLLVRPQGAEISLPQHMTKLSMQCMQISDDIDYETPDAEAVERLLKRKREETLPELSNGRAEAVSAIAGNTGLKAAAHADQDEEARVADPHAAPSNGDEAGSAVEGSAVEEGDLVQYFTEARLEEGDEVYVLGTARPRAAQDGTAAAAAGDATQNATPLVIGSTPDSDGPFWASYQSIFEVALGSEEDLMEKKHQEAWQQIRQGVVMVAVGVGLGGLALLLVLSLG